MDKDVEITWIKTDGDFQILDIFLTKGWIQPDVLGRLMLPEGMDFAKGIVINGKAPIWLYARLVVLCQQMPYVATFDPRMGAIVVASRADAGRRVGDIIPGEEILPLLPTPSDAPKEEGLKPSIPSKVIAFLGPPHSGKSVLLNALRLRMQEELPPDCFQRDFFIVRACPDGEGDWFSEIPKDIALTLRYKGSFDDKFVDQVCKELEQLRQQKRLLLVDCGGKIDKKNQRVFNLCTHALIVSRDPECIPEWRGAARASELEILAEVESVPTPCAEVLRASPLVIRLGKLERGAERDLQIPTELIEAVKERLGHGPLHRRMEGEERR